MKYISKAFDGLILYYSGWFENIMPRELLKLYDEYEEFLNQLNQVQKEIDLIEQSIGQPLQHFRMAFSRIKDLEIHRFEATSHLPLIKLRTQSPKQNEVWPEVAASTEEGGAIGTPDTDVLTDAEINRIAEMRRGDHIQRSDPELEAEILALKNKWFPWMNAPEAFTSQYLIDKGFDLVKFHRYIQAIDTLDHLYEAGKGFHARMLATYDKVEPDERALAKARGASQSALRKTVDDWREIRASKDNPIMHSLHEAYKTRCSFHAFYTQNEKIIGKCEQLMYPLHQLETMAEDPISRQERYRSRFPAYLAELIPRDIYIKGKKEFVIAGPTNTERKVVSLVEFLQGINSAMEQHEAIGEIKSHLQELSINVAPAVHLKIYTEALGDNMRRARAEQVADPRPQPGLQ